MQAERSVKRPKYHAKYKPTGEIVPVFSVDADTRQAEIHIRSRFPLHPTQRTVVPSGHLSSFTPGSAADVVARIRFNEEVV